MLSVAELKKKACGTIEAHRDELVGVAKEILANPEVGFSETKTARLVADKFSELGIQRTLAGTVHRNAFRIRNYGECCHK